MPAAVTPKLKDEILEELDAPYPLQQGDVDFYQDNGYVRLQNVFSADLLITFGELVTASVRAANVQSLEDDDDYAKAFTQVMNLWEHDQTVRSFVFSKRLAGIASQLLQVPPLTRKGSGHYLWALVRLLAMGGSGPAQLIGHPEHQKAATLHTHSIGRVFSSFAACR